MFRTHAGVKVRTNVALPNLLCDLDIRTIYKRPVNIFRGAVQPNSRYSPTVPSSSPPLRQNFIFDVPLASVPAVEMCWLMSDAGMSTSASDTE